MPDLQLHLDRATTFYDYLRIDGWLLKDEDDLSEIVVAFGDRVVHRETKNLHLPSPDIGINAHCRFVISTLLPDGFDKAGPTLTFLFRDGSEHVLSIEAYVHERFDAAEHGFIRFRELVRQRPGARVLEIGSRARSGEDRRQDFPSADYVGTDLLAGPNVDVVADAHELSRVLGDRRFDFAFSISTFEHVAMPWKVVIELNRVLEPGGVVYVQSHQTCGMHDLPWDFWRFSDSAYRALFNRHAGFEVIETGQERLLHTIPFLRFTPDWSDVEDAAGYYLTYVMAEKVSSTALEWNVPLADVARESYPF